MEVSFPAFDTTWDFSSSMKGPRTHLCIYHLGGIPYNETVSMVRMRHEKAYGRLRRGILLQVSISCLFVVHVEVAVVGEVQNGFAVVQLFRVDLPGCHSVSKEGM